MVVSGTCRARPASNSSSGRARGPGAVRTPAVRAGGCRGSGDRACGAGRSGRRHRGRTDRGHSIRGGSSSVVDRDRARHHRPDRAPSPGGEARRRPGAGDQAAARHAPAAVMLCDDRIAGDDPSRRVVSLHAAPRPAICDGARVVLHPPPPALRATSPAKAGEERSPSRPFEATLPAAPPVGHRHRQAGRERSPAAPPVGHRHRQGGGGSTPTWSGPGPSPPDRPSSSSRPPRVRPPCRRPPSRACRPSCPPL